MNTTRWSMSRVVAGLAILTAAFAAGPALAANAFGVRTGVYTDANAGFLGGEFVTTIAPNWYFNPNLEVAVSSDRDVVTVNGDFHYDFLADRPYWVWAGGGPAVIHREFEFDPDRTDFGVNVLGGIGWKTRSAVSPYVQAKVTFSNSDEAVLAFGLRF